MISKSYPYLYIAKQYHVDYADVLAVAQHLTHGVDAPQTTMARMPVAAIDRICVAALDYRAIQNGIAPFPPT